VCLRSEIQQVLLNLVVNAAHAIGDANRHRESNKGVIRVRTRLDAREVELTVSDSGTGIPNHIQSRIFNPFFTTKEVGKGTGQGLALVHDIVVKKHGGSVRFETEVGQGTTFIVRLPVGHGETT
jgi:signal transduction histidine kinase